MKKLLLILSLSVAGSASAQTIASSELTRAGAPSETATIEINIPHSSGTLASPMADNSVLSYHDIDAAAAGWQAPLQVGSSLVVLRYAQRFTLPAASGFLDSVRIRFSQVTGDTIYILIMKDTLQDGPNGEFHTMDVYTNTVYAGLAIPVNILPQVADENGWVMISFPHIPVPKEFHVVLAPRILSDGTNISATSQFVTVATNVTGTTPTTESARSNFLALTGQGLQPVSMDNFFQVDGTPVAVNFHMAAYVQTETGSVDRPSTTPAAMYPNPVSASNMLKIEHNEMISSVRVVNMLGNEVLGWDGMRKVVELSAAGLAKGVYHVIVNTENGMTTEKLIVE